MELIVNRDGSSIEVDVTTGDFNPNPFCFQLIRSSYDYSPLSEATKRSEFDRIDG